MLRQINELVDFTFVYDELKNQYCLDNGRNAIDPIRMFKYLLLKAIFELSDVDIVERSKYDLSFKYFLHMAPEDPVIDPNSLTKFRKLRIKNLNLLDLLINKTVEIAYCEKPIAVVEAQGGRKKEKEFQFNKDAGMYVCKAGHMAVRKARQGKKGVGKNQVDAYYFDIEKCKRCPFQEECYTTGEKAKPIR